jgi:Tfp pilus assembly protein PilV
MGILKHKVKASSLIEVLVAMVIMMSTMGIGLAIYQNLTHDSNDDLKIRAEIELNSLASETKLNKTYSEVTIEEEDMRLQRSIEIYEKSKRLRILYLQAFTPFGKKITEYKEIIVIP